jgi:hypothetical protein
MFWINAVKKIEAILQGVDETTARRRAQDEIDDDPGKD